MKYNFDEAVNRRGTYSMKWDGGDLIRRFGIAERYDEESLPLFTADMDLPVAQPIIDALHKTVDHRIFGYSAFPATYFEAIQHWFKVQYDWEIQKEEIVYSPGTVHALAMAVRAFTEPGDGIIIQRPVYPPFTSVVEGNGRKVVNNRLKKDDQYYSIDFEDFEAKAALPDTKMFILCNPHNPTGRIFGPEELRTLSDICARHGVLIVADEIHGELIRVNQTFTPMAKTVDNSDHIITCTAINKTFNVAGLHCSNIVISNKDLREKFAATLGFQLASPFAMSALIAAYNEGQDWLDQLKVYIDGTIDWVAGFVANNLPKVKVRPPEGTYIMWLDFSGYGLHPDEVHDRIYNRANVILEDGVKFGEEGLEYQRICVPSPRPMIQEAMRRIQRVFADVE